MEGLNIFCTCMKWLVLCKNCSLCILCLIAELFLKEVLMRPYSVTLASLQKFKLIISCEKGVWPYDWENKRRLPLNLSRNSKLGLYI